MMSIPHLNGHHRKALASVFRHPPSHNVEWHDVLALLNHIGVVTERHGGSFDVRIGDHETVLIRPKSKDLEGDQLRELKQFLMIAGLAPEDGVSPAASASDRAAGDGHAWIALIDHHQAKLFELDDDGRHARKPIVLAPDDSDGSRGRVEHRQGNDDHDGGHAFEIAGYYDRICHELGRATQIVLLSDAQGRSSAGEHLLDYLKRHHADVAPKIVAMDRVDIAHLSDGAIVAAGADLLDAHVPPVSAHGARDVSGAGHIR